MFVVASPEKSSRRRSCFRAQRRESGDEGLWAHSVAIEAMRSSCRFLAQMKDICSKISRSFRWPEGDVLDLVRSWMHVNRKYARIRL